MQLAVTNFRSLATRRQRASALTQLLCAILVGFAFFGCGDGVGRPLRAERGALSGSGGSIPNPQGGSPSTGGSVDIPLTSHCAPADEWEVEAVRLEEALLLLLNAARAFGSPCDPGDRDEGEEVPGLVMLKELRCSARLHTRDMVERGFFGRINPDGDSPEERMRLAGAEFETASEVIVSPEELLPGEQQALTAFLGILSEESKCENALDERFSKVGIGYYEQNWTLDLSGP